MQVNKTDAAKLAGVARRTFYEHIKSKGISVIRDEVDGLEKVDVSELERIYGFERVASNREKLEKAAVAKSQEGNSLHAHSHDVAHEVTPSHTEIRVREQAKEIEKLNTILEIKENAHNQRIEDLEATIQEIRKKADSFQLLLENHNKEKDLGQEWKQSFKSLEARIANQEQETKQQRAIAEKRLRQALHFKKKLEAETSKSFWKRLFG